MALITMEEIEQLSPAFKGDSGNALANRLLHITGIDQLSERYARHEDKSGPEFIELFLRDLGVDYLVAGLEHMETLAEGPFITISNHPYGGLDGLILIDLVGHLRADFKVMANQFLNHVKTIKDNFISVVPATDRTVAIAKESIAGLRKAIAQVMDGHPLGLFPAGAVSNLTLKGIRDREWQESAIRLIMKLKAPIVPIRFFDCNSFFFYFLGLVSWKLRTLQLPREVLNKKGQKVRLGIGPIISVEQQQQCPSQEALGAMLRNAVYDMTLPTTFVKRSDISFAHPNGSDI